MTEKIPPIIEEGSETKPETETQLYLETVVTANNDYPIDPKAEAEIKALKNQIKYQQSPTAIMLKKEDGGKKDGTIYNLPENRPKPKGGVKTAILAITAGFMSLFANKEAKAGTGPEDSLNKKPLTEKVVPADSVESRLSKRGFEQSVDGENEGHITIESHTFIPQSDTTKEVYVYYFSDDGKSKNSLGEILNIMAKKGLKPADGELLERIYNENKNNVEFQKKAKWVMAPTPEGDADDTKQNEKFLVSKDGKTAYVLPEHSVFRTINPRGLNRFELDQGFDSGEYGLVFYK